MRDRMNEIVSKTANAVRTTATGASEAVLASVEKATEIVASSTSAAGDFASDTARATAEMASSATAMGTKMMASVADASKIAGAATADVTAAAARKIAAGTVTAVAAAASTASDAAAMSIKVAGKATEFAEGTANIVGDLNGDGKFDAADVRIARDRVASVAGTISSEIADLGKAVIRSDIAKQTASGAAIGAAIAIPVPIIGPVFGAVFGAGLVAYQNVFKSGDGFKNRGRSENSVVKDVAEELDKLHKLKLDGVLSDEEFDHQKRKLLR